MWPKRVMRCCTLSWLAGYGACRAIASNGGGEPMALRYRAAWVFPVDQPPLANGVVAVDDGAIIAVGPADQLGFDIDLQDAALLPGLVNAHVHLDLTYLRGKLAPPVDDPTLWLESVIAHRRATTPTETEAAIRAGVDECLSSGVSCVGDIDGTGIAARLLPATPLRGIVFRELLGLTPPAVEHAIQIAAAAIREFRPNGRITLGLGPHAPYSVCKDLLTWIADERRPTAIHLAEFKDEKRLLTDHDGVFRNFLARIGVWNDNWDPNVLTAHPHEVLALLSKVQPLVLAHCNYLDAPWADLRGASIVYCPRTHAYFRHPPHPFPRLLAHGINVALGTDGLASNPDLNLFKEMQFLWKRHGDQLVGSVLLDMGTRNGARALGLSSTCGNLGPGKAADLLVLALEKTTGADPYRLLFESSGRVNRLLIAGRERVRDGAVRPSSLES
jgi:cytosine/adenosine deaminase-related metal-dependent hydrolase